MKKTIITIVVIVVLIALYFIGKSFSSPASVVESPAPSTTETGNPTASTTTQNVVPTNGSAVVIGQSIEGRDITAYHFGSGKNEILFVGGIHGGYEWNTALVAYQLIDYLKSNPTAITPGVRVTVIPVLNPDGLNKVVGTTTGKFTKADVSTDTATVVAGRFNGDDVDLNRNFDCDWKSTGVWQNTTVSGGSSAFSEPESRAIKNYVEMNNPVAVIVWYSAAGGVYASNCHNGVSALTSTLMNTFATGSGYPAYDSFDFYATTGDMTNWLAKNNIPAISVLLTNHSDTEWSKNKAGIQAVINAYSK